MSVQTNLTDRVVKHYEAVGYVVDVTERWIPKTRIKKDLFGVFDFLAVGHDLIIGVQLTDFSNFAARRKKIIASPEALAWARVPSGRIELVGCKDQQLKRQTFTAVGAELLPSEVCRYKLLT